MSRSGGRADGSISIGEQQGVPTGAVGQSCGRAVVAADLAALTSGTLYMVGLALPAGVTVANLSFVSGATALSAGVNQWAALFTPARVQSAISADGTNTAWAANAAKTFVMTTPYVVPTSGLYYAGLCIVATVPSLRGPTAPGNVVLLGTAPIVCGTSNTGLTNPASCPGTANAITATVNLAYCYAT